MLKPWLQCSWTTFCINTKHARESTKNPTMALRWQNRKPSKGYPITLSLPKKCSSRHSLSLITKGWRFLFFSLPSNGSLLSLLHCQIFPALFCPLRPHHLPTIKPSSLELFIVGCLCLVGEVSAGNLGPKKR